MWFPAIEGDITQLDAHSHNGADSPFLTNTAFNGSAAIVRSNLAAGVAYRILANSLSGAMSENAALTANHVIKADANGQLSGEANLAISRGGTNSGTANGGFNNLAPTTTKGDIVAYSTVNARVAIGTDGQVLTADSASTPGLKWATATAAPNQSYEIMNLTLTASVAASALTIAVKQSDGSSDPGAGAGAVKIGFRSATAATGTYTQRSITGALSLVISSGSTLGHASAVAHYIYIYAIDNAGTVELAASSSLFDEGTRVSSTTEGGAGAADSNATMYSTTGRTSVGCRLIGRLQSTQATAGTWATAIAEISLIPFLSEAVSASASGGTTSSATSAYTTVIPNSKDWDSHNFYSTSTGIFTVPSAGRYRLTGCWEFAANTWSTNASTGRLKGVQAGSASTERQLGYVTKTPAGTAGENMILQGCAVFNCVAGDTLKMQAFQNFDGASSAAGTGTASTCYIQCERIGK